MLTARLQPIAKEIDLLISKDMDPQARARFFASEARKGLAEAQQVNQRALGMVPPHDQFVDGSKGKPLESVNPDRGTIAFVFQLVGEVVDWCYEQVVFHSPVLEGDYRQSHIILADGVEVRPEDKIETAREWVLTTTSPYGRKMEPPRTQSDQAPEGVYHAVAALASKRFSNIALVRFTYRDIIGADTSGMTRRERAAVARDNRRPAIVITLR